MEIQPFEDVNFLYIDIGDFPLSYPKKWVLNMDGFSEKSNKYLEHCVFGSPRFRSVSLGDPTDTARWERP